MKTVALTLLLSAIILGGCAGTRTTPSSFVYDFGPSAKPIESKTLDRFNERIALEIRVSPWVDSPHIDYRLAYEDLFKRHEYASSLWAGSPSVLLEQQWRQQLRLTGVNSRITIACLLRVEVQEFAQVFNSPQSSHASLQGQVSLVDDGRQLLALRPFNIEQAAATADAPGGVRALIQAGENLGQEISVWLEQLEKGKILQKCGG